MLNIYRQSIFFTFPHLMVGIMRSLTWLSSHFFLSMFKLLDKLCAVYLYYQCVIFSLYSSSNSSTAFLAISLLLVHNTAHPDNVSSFNRWRLKRKYIKMLFTNIYWSFFCVKLFAFLFWFIEIVYRCRHRNTPEKKIHLHRKPKKWNGMA